MLGYTTLSFMINLKCVVFFDSRCMWPNNFVATHLHTNSKVYVAYHYNCGIETKELLGQCKSGSISEIVQHVISSELTEVT